MCVFAVAKCPGIVQFVVCCVCYNNDFKVVGTKKSINTTKKEFANND